MRTFAVILVVLVVLAACGGAPATTTRPAGAASAPAASTPDSGDGTATEPPAAAGGRICDVLPASEVARVTGQPATLTPDQAADDEDSCSYNIGPADELIPEYVVDFRLESAGTDLSGPKVAFSGGQDIAGVGDAAYWAPSVTVMWFVHRGNTYAIQFVLFGEDDGDALAIAQQLAQAAIPRL